MSKMKSKKNVSKKRTNKHPVKYLSILKSAEEIFAAVGFHDATISSIANKAKVSEATIYEYFDSKENLLFSIPAELIKKHRMESEAILEYIHGAEGKLKALIYRELKLYAINPNYAKISMLILKTNRNFLATEAYRIVQESARLWIQVIEEGIKNGEFREDIQPYLGRAMIWGAIEHLVIRQSLLGKPEDLLSLADEITHTIFQGILGPKKETSLNIHITMEHKK